MLNPYVLTCPYCGEDVELVIDEGGGDQQSYVEDCPVCCRPNRIFAQFAAPAPLR